MKNERYTSRGVHQRANGKWEVYMSDNLTCKRISRTVSAKNKAEALSIQRDLLTKLNAGVEAFDCGVTVGNALENYIRMLDARGETEPSTLASYANDAKVIEGYIGNWRLNKLTPGRVDQWMANMKRDGYSKTTISRAFTRLKAALKYAQANDLIVKNPCEFTHPPKQSEKKSGDYVILSDEERSRMLGLCFEALPDSLAIAVILALGAGLRREEVCGLRASDYDEANGVISIKRAVALARGGAYIKPPKTAASEREIPVGENLAAVLGSIKATMLNEVGLFGVEYDPYFAGKWVPDGPFYHPTQLSKDFAAFRKINGFPDGLRFHDLRHGWVTLALKMGGDVGTVADYAGHAKPSQTLNVYCNPDLEARRKVAQAVDLGLGWNGCHSQQCANPNSID